MLGHKTFNAFETFDVRTWFSIQLKSRTGRIKSMNGSAVSDNLIRKFFGEFSALEIWHHTLSYILTIFFVIRIMNRYMNNYNRSIFSKSLRD